MKFKKAKFSGDIGNITAESQQDLLNELDRLMKEGSGNPITDSSTEDSRKEEFRPRPPRSDNRDKRKPGNQNPVRDDVKPASTTKPINPKVSMTRIDDAPSDSGLTFKPFQGIKGALFGNKDADDDVRTGLTSAPRNQDTSDEDASGQDESDESEKNEEYGTNDSTKENSVKILSRNNAEYVQEIDDIEEKASSPKDTFEASFSPITIDSGLSRIFIDDMTSMEIKSHCINLHCLQDAKTDYASTAYQQYKKLGLTALMFIAGPTLIVKEGNPRFQDFLNSVGKITATKIDNFESLRMYVIVKVEDEESENIKRACEDLLVYCMSDDAIKAYSDIMETFEQNDIALDFLCGLFTLATSRYSTPWHDPEYIDGYIDDNASVDEDLDFVLDIIENDERTIKGSMSYNDFILNHSMGTLDFIWDQLVEARRVFEKLLNPYDGDDCYEVAPDFLVDDDDDEHMSYDPGEKDAIMEAATSVKGEDSVTISESYSKEVDIVVEKVDDPSQIAIEKYAEATKTVHTASTGGPLVVPKLL